MTRTIDLPEADRTILRALLRAHLPAGTQVWVFGSRANGTARRYSDLDLALEGASPLTLDVLGRLSDALSESDLTIKVDLVDLRAIDPAFRRRIEAEIIALHDAALRRTV
jgi:predicted nucleotidyltransferase